MSASGSQLLPSRQILLAAPLSTICLAEDWMLLALLGPGCKPFSARPHHLLTPPGWHDLLKPHLPSYNTLHELILSAPDYPRDPAAISSTLASNLTIPTELPILPDIFWEHIGLYIASLSLPATLRPDATGATTYFGPTSPGLRPFCSYSDSIALRSTTPATPGTPIPGAWGRL